MSEEFIKEVDEEIKEERQMQLWKKLAPYFIALASAIILITISIVGWQTYSMLVSTLIISSPPHLK